MKASELRIGNWVLQEPKNARVETIIDAYDLENLQFYPDKYGCEYEPIPLTEEWLKRFNWNPPKDIGVSFSLTTDDIHFVAGNYYKKIEYVHQLQNLYFALTGEELHLSD